MERSLSGMEPEREPPAEQPEDPYVVSPERRRAIIEQARRDLPEEDRLFAEHMKQARGEIPPPRRWWGFRFQGRETA